MYYHLIIFIFTFIVMSISSVIDIKTKKVPNWLTMMFIFISFLITSIFNRDILLSSIACVAVLFVLCDLGIAGGGDIKLLMGVSLLCGWKVSLFTLAIASISLIVFTVITNFKEVLNQTKKFCHNMMFKDFSSLKDGKGYSFAPHLTVGFVITSIVMAVKGV